MRIVIFMTVTVGLITLRMDLGPRKRPLTILKQIQNVDIKCIEISLEKYVIRNTLPHENNMKRDILDHMWLFTSKGFLFVLLLGMKRFHSEINQQAATRNILNDNGVYPRKKTTSSPLFTYRQKRPNTKKGSYNVFSNPFQS